MPLSIKISIINMGINDITALSCSMKLPSNNGLIRAAKEVSAIACIIIPITARIKTFEVNVGQTHRFGVLDIFVKRCVFSKPIFKPESLAFIKIKDNSDRLSEVKFRGWMFASSPALNALENSVYDVSILVCKKVDKELKKSSSVEAKE